jgi:anti-sigma-K factor RskA
MTGNEHNTQDELASYALQNLPVAESAAIRAHLQGCLPCRIELAQVSGDLAMLGIAVAQSPLPAGARQRFLEKIAGTASASASASASAAAKVTPITVKRRGAGFWVPWAAVAAMAIVSVLLGIQNRALNDELNGESNLVKNLAAQASRAQQVLEVLTAPQAQRVTLTEGKVAAQPSARATYLPERGGMILLATNLKPLPAGKTYQLWIIPADGKAPVSAGLFHPDTAGSATLVLPTLQAGIAAKAFGVTVENAGGATSPTMPIVLAGATGG